MLHDINVERVHGYAKELCTLVATIVNRVHQHTTLSTIPVANALTEEDLELELEAIALEADASISQDISSSAVLEPQRASTAPLSSNSLPLPDEAELLHPDVLLSSHAIVPIRDSEGGPWW